MCFNNQGWVSWMSANVVRAFLAAVTQLDKSLSPTLTLSWLWSYPFSWSDFIYLFYIAYFTFWLTIMGSPPFHYKLTIPILHITYLLIPFTSQFFLHATPIFAYLITFYTSHFIPASWNPATFISLLPTLKSILYGTNISNILTCFTHPSLDITAFLWFFHTKKTLHFLAHTFRYMHMVGVIIQILLPCSTPWYKLIHSLMPANYSMKGSPGGLAHIDALFHSYTLLHSPMCLSHSVHCLPYTQAAQPSKLSAYPTFS